MEKFRPEVRAVGRRTMWAVFLAVLAAGLLISGAAMAAAPKIASTSPTHNQQNVDPAAPIVITFDQNISTDQGPDLLSGVDPKIKVTPATGEGGQALGLSASISGNKITITHSVKFAEGTAYQVSVERIKNDNNEYDDPTKVTSPGPTLQNPWVFFIRDTKSP
ncbi:MAG: Ig-like domain-containing protein, partial [Armatimonadota bacterium]